MATIFPGDGLPENEVAQVLLDIVGPDRVREVRTGTGPKRFEVPDDVAVEFERRLRIGQMVEATKAAPVRRSRPKREETGR